MLKQKVLRISIQKTYWSAALCCALYLMSAIQLAGCERCSDNSDMGRTAESASDDERTGSAASSEDRNSTGLVGDAEQADSWIKESALLSHIPATARAVVFARDLNEAAAGLNFAANELSIDALKSWRMQFFRFLKNDTLLKDDEKPASNEDEKSREKFDEINTAEALSAAGIDTTQPAALFYDRGYWVLAARLKDVGALNTRVKTLKNDAIALKKGEKNEKNEKNEKSAKYGIKTIDSGRSGAFETLKITGSFEDSTTNTKTDTSDTVVWLGWDRHTVLVATRVVQTDLNMHDESLPTTWLADASTARFQATEAHQKLFEELSPHGHIAGIIRPAAWMADIDSQGHAQQLLQRLSSQVGPVGLALSAPGWQDTMELRVLTPGNPRAPAMVTGLGRAEGPLSVPEGLIEPGILALARLSIDPRQLYALFISVLPAAQREEMQTYWAKLDQELEIDARQDVLENLGGHAVLAVYGLDIDDADPRDTGIIGQRLLRTLTLQNTREALLFTIKKRAPLEHVLDALTAISKGKLSRQVAGDTIQYAWLEDGALQWALLLGDDHLIYVDSAVGFEHARAYERGERALPGELKKLGVDQLFNAQDTAGLYVDSASLSAILRETDASASPEIERAPVAPGEDGAAQPTPEQELLADESRLGKAARPAPANSWRWLSAFRSVLITTHQAPGTQTGITRIQLKTDAPVE